MVNFHLLTPSRLWVWIKQQFFSIWTIVYVFLRVKEGAKLGQGNAPNTSYLGSSYYRFIICYGWFFSFPERLHLTLLYKHTYLCSQSHSQLSECGSKTFVRSSFAESLVHRCLWQYRATDHPGYTARTGSVIQSHPIWRNHCIGRFSRAAIIHGKLAWYNNNNSPSCLTMDCFAISISFTLPVTATALKWRLI